MKYFLAVIGMVFILEGLPYLTYPDRLKAHLLRLASLPDATLRALGALAVAAGLALLYFGTA